MLKACKYLMLGRHGQKNSMENIYLAYRTIIGKKGGSLKGMDLHSLIEAMLLSYPGDLKTIFIDVWAWLSDCRT